MQSKKEQLYALDIFIYNKIKFFSENKNGNGYCNMLNKTFAEETNRKPVSISRSISKLLKLGYIESVGNKQFRRLRITDKKFTYDKFVNNLDNIVNNLDNIVNNLDKGLIGLINNLDKPKLTILINLINNLDKQRIMNIIMNNNNEIINKEEVVVEDIDIEKTTTTATEILKNWYGSEFKNVYLTEHNYKKLLGMTMSEKLLDELIENLSQKIAEGKEKNWSQETPSIHYARLRAYWDYRRKNPDKFREKPSEPHESIYSNELDE